MDTFLIICSLCLICVGYIGAFIPGLSGPPIAWLGFLALYFVKHINIPLWVVVVLALVALISFILEWTIPAFGTKVFKGTKYGVRGSYLGMIIGILVPIPFGFLIGPFVGAYLGELYYDNDNHKRALTAAFGTFIGFIFAILINFAMVSLIAMIWFYYLYLYLF